MSSKIAKRYAQGLLDLTQEMGITSTVNAEMKDLVKILLSSHELNSFLLAPFIDLKKKISVATAIFKNFSPVSQNLVKLVIKHGRQKNLKAIAQEYVNKVEDAENVQRVSLTVAAPISQKNTDKILRSTPLIKEISKIDLKNIINPDIIGGYILRVADQQIDTSVRTQLSNIKKEFQV